MKIFPMTSQISLHFHFGLLKGISVSLHAIRMESVTTFTPSFLKKKFKKEKVSHKVLGKALVKNIHLPTITGPKEDFYFPVKWPQL